jgi:predicted GNAT family N-acyltransferase
VRLVVSAKAPLPISRAEIYELNHLRVLVSSYGIQFPYIVIDQHTTVDTRHLISHRLKQATILVSAYSDIAAPSRKKVKKIDYVVVVILS